MKLQRCLLFISWLMLAGNASAQYFDCPDEIFPRQDRTTKLWGYKDLTGEWRVPAIFLKAYGFEGKNAIVMQGKKYNVIDCEGRSVVSGYDDIASFIWGKGWAKTNNKWTLVDDKGRQLIAPIYDEVKEVKQRGTMTWVQKDGKWGLLSKDDGRFIIPLQYDTYLNMSDSAAIVRQGNLYRIVEYTKGSTVQDDLSAIIPLNKNNYAFRRNGKWGVVDAYANLRLRPDSDTLWMQGEYFYIKQNNLYGLRTLGGRDIVPAEYQEISNFSEGLARVRKAGKYGFISPAGKEVVPAIYDYAEPIKNYRAIVAQNGKYGVWNIRTQAYAIPLEHSLIKRNYSYEFYAVTTEGKAYFTSLDGQKLNKEAFDSIYVNDAIEKMRVKAEGKFRFYNAQLLRYASELSFEEAAPFVAGYACVKNTGKWGIINEQGLLAVPHLYDKSPKYLSVNSSKQLFEVTLKGLHGVIDASGKVLLQTQYDLIAPSDQKLFKVKQGGKYGLAKLSGEWVLQPTYAAMSNAKETTQAVPEFPAMVQKGKKWGLVNFKAEEIYEPLAEQIIFVQEGLYAFQAKGKWGLLSTQGKEITPNEYEQIGNFSDRLAPAKQGGKWGFINANGKMQIPAQYEDVTEFNSKSAYVKQNGKWGAINRSGKFLLPAEYDGYEILSNGTRRLYKK